MAQFGFGWGSAQTQKERVELEREAAIRDGRDFMSLIAAYVLVTYRNRTVPCPNLERAKDYAQLRGTEEHPVTVHKQDKVLYRYPEE